MTGAGQSSAVVLSSNANSTDLKHDLQKMVIFSGRVGEDLTSDLWCVNKIDGL